jgi:streptomycin 3"-adenylyltransferase
MSRPDTEAAVTRLVQAVAGEALVGVYRHGSAVLGGLLPGSDVDLLVVTSRSLDQDQRRALVDGLLRRSGRRAIHGPARPVELVVVVHDDVAPWRYPPVCDFLYGEWLRADYDAGTLPQREDMPDLAVLIRMTLDADAVVSGPPPAQVLDDVPAADVVSACLDGVQGLLWNLREDTRNVLLTLARIWMTVATGRIARKDVAAAWAAERLNGPHREVLLDARGAYLAGLDLAGDFRATAEHLVVRLGEARLHQPG